MAHDQRGLTLPVPLKSPAGAPRRRSEWRAVGMLFPYLWEFRVRVALALAFLTTAKLANVGVPLVLKEVVDSLDTQTAVLVLPLALLAAYGILRFSTTLFAELRDVVFVRVTQRAIRRVALAVFRHMHGLSLRFHLERQTGGVSRDIERGTRGISTLLSYMLFSIIPVLLEFGLVAAILLAKFDWRFAAVTFAAVTVYMVFTVSVTEWRMEIRRWANELDSRANTRAIDSLINYETVKYFNNEEYEARRYDDNLQKYESAAVKNEASLGLLNIGQSLIIAVAVTALMVLAAGGVVAKTLTLGDLVLVNGLLIQLYIPLNFLGMVYREIKQALADMDRMFRLLTQDRDIEDRGGALRARRLFLRSEAADPVRRLVRGALGQQGRRGGPQRLGQIDARAPLVSLLRSQLGQSDDQRRRHPRGGADVPARRDRHRASGHGAVQRYDPLQHPLRQARRVARRGDRSGKSRAYPRIHREPSREVRIARRRAGPEALRRRETARRDRPRRPEKSGHPHLRRGDLCARLGNRAGHPGRARPHRQGANDAGDRSPPFNGDGRGPDSRSGSRPYRRARNAQGAAGARRRVRPDVGASAAGGGRAGGSGLRSSRRPPWRWHGGSARQCEVFGVSCYFRCKL